MAKIFRDKAEIFTWVPNTKNYYNNFQFDGLVLSGGNDLFEIKKNNENLIRDEIELKLLSYSIKNLFQY